MTALWRAVSRGDGRYKVLGPSGQTDIAGPRSHDTKQGAEQRANDLNHKVRDRALANDRVQIG